MSLRTFITTLIERRATISALQKDLAAHKLRAERAEALLAGLMGAQRLFESELRALGDAWSYVDNCQMAADEHLKEFGWTRPESGVEDDDIPF